MFAGWMQVYQKKTPKLHHLSAIKPFLFIASNLYLLKIPKNPRFSGIFRIYNMGTLAIHWLQVQIKWFVLESVLESLL